jgi:DNA-binding HxlR family transcriptional regulator
LRTAQSKHKPLPDRKYLLKSDILTKKLELNKYRSFKALDLPENIQQARSILANKQVFTADCVVPLLLEQIGSKWAILIIYALSQGVKRYGQLQRQIEGVSPKMLIQNLRKLEACGLVRRKVYPVVPPQVEYSLTPLGESLVDPLAMLFEWAEHHIDDLSQLKRDRP